MLLSSIPDMVLVILLVDGSWALSMEKQKADELILARLRELTLPTTLVINKVMLSISGML